MLLAKPRNTHNDLYMSYDGNRLSHIMDAADRVVLESSLDFDSETGEAYYEYDSDGRLILDTGTGIEHITYAPNDMPVKIERASGQIAYTYRADGTKVSRTVVTEGRGRPIARNHYYVGPFQFTNNSTARTIRLERINLPWGYFDDKLTPMVNLTDYQGNIRAVFSQYHGLTMQTTDYYPYGLPKATSTNPTVNAYKYGGKELSTDFGIDCYDFEARLQLPAAGLFSRPDPKSWDYPDTNPYLYCAANPVMFTDPTGEAWKPLFEDEDNPDVCTGYLWIDPKYSYDEHGNLLDGLYEQAIFFSQISECKYIGESGKERDYNIGTSLATVYASDGSISEFKACTYPSNPDKFSTVPDGMLEGIVGTHKGDYEAIHMSDVGNSNREITISEDNKANPKQGKVIKFANIHKPGAENLTGKTWNGKYISECCFLIDIYQWDNFMSKFEKSSIISIAVSRTKKYPQNHRRIKSSMVEKVPLKNLIIK